MKNFCEKLWCAKTFGGSLKNCKSFCAAAPCHCHKTFLCPIVPLEKFMNSLVFILTALYSGLMLLYIYIMYSLYIKCIVSV